jgi:hypothetical protein
MSVGNTRIGREDVSQMLRGGRRDEVNRSSRVRRSRCMQLMLLASNIGAKSRRP